MIKQRVPLESMRLPSPPTLSLPSPTLPPLPRPDLGAAAQGARVWLDDLSARVRAGAMKRGLLSAQQSPASAQLSMQHAGQVVSEWQRTKALALGRAHNARRLDSVLTGGMLKQWQQRAADVKAAGWCVAAVVFGVQRCRCNKCATDLFEPRGIYFMCCIGCCVVALSLGCIARPHQALGVHAQQDGGGGGAGCRAGVGARVGVL